MSYLISNSTDSKFKTFPDLNSAKTYARDEAVKGRLSKGTKDSVPLEGEKSENFYVVEVIHRYRKYSGILHKGMRSFVRSKFAVITPGDNLVKVRSLDKAKEIGYELAQSGGTSLLGSILYTVKPTVKISAQFV